MCMWVREGGEVFWSCVSQWERRGARLTECKVVVCVYVGEGGGGGKTNKNKFGVCLGIYVRVS